MANPTNEHTSSKPHYYNSFALILLSLILIHLSPVVNSATTTHSHKWDGIILTQSDYQSLLTFKHTIDPTGIFLSPTWNTTRQSSCTSWPGLRCQKGRVIAIHLPFKGLYGQITPKISYLTALRVLSLHDNFITGHIPHSITLLSNLRSLYLFNNRLSGPIPPSIFSLIPNLINLDLSGNSLNGSFNLPPKLNSNRLYRLNLSSNSFSGSIPQSLGNNNNLSTTLTILDLSKNNFSGEIPSSLSNLTHLTIFNVSHNTLSGNIPSPLSKKFNSSSFIGNRNLQLCGFTNSPPCPSSSPSPSPYSSPDILPPPSPSTSSSTTHTRKLSTKDIILISAGAVLVILLLLCCILLCCLIRKRMVSRSRNKGPETSSSSVSRGEKQTGHESSAIATTSNSTGKLVLFDGPFVFTAEDLLCATAEIMGKSPFGTVYKATLEDGNQVAVKRLREKLAKNPKEFENEVSNLGKIRHPHLLPLRAYYLGPKGEKLLVYDYLNKGSLSSFLHGGRSPETVIDWSVRMKIILGVARGLLHLHTQHNLIHGNLTSGDIYLDEQTSPRISDYGLSKLMTDTANANVISAASTTTTTTTGSITGYRAPELQKTRKPTTKTDIYSFGVIILELLTGKAPNEAVNGLELPQWVASVVKEEWSNEVFDLELMSGMKNDGDDEMVNTLKLALHMIDPSPDARPDAKQVVNQIEEISPQLGGDDEDDGNDDDDDDD